MNDANNKKLKEDFPLLYSHFLENMTPNQTLMAYGLECGDGWFKVVYDLSRQIECMIKTLPSESRELFYVDQVKEKFGSLRFYMHTSTDEMDEMIRAAEAKSMETCEECGA